MAKLQRHLSSHQQYANQEGGWRGGRLTAKDLFTAVRTLQEQKSIAQGSQSGYIRDFKDNVDLGSSCSDPGSPESMATSYRLEVYKDVDAEMTGM